MAETVLRERWNHTSSICAAVFAASSPGLAVDPRQFHPLERHAAAAGNSIELDAEAVRVVARGFER